MQVFYKIGVIACLLFFVCSIQIFGTEIDDPAMEFYLNKTDSVLNGSILFNNKLKYSVSITSIYNKISYRGIPDESDTAGYVIKFVNGEFIESQIIDTASLEENIIPSNLQFKKPWEFNCRFYFFPKDTGAGDLAIGFVSADTLEKNAPEGLIVINRDTYQIKQIYLHYLAFDEYEWMSRAYEFSYENKTMLLKSLTIQGCYFGFFQRRYFRQDLIFNNYIFQ